MIDITGSEGVGITIRNDGKIIWINTAEEGCVLRICRIKKLELTDEREEEDFSPMAMASKAIIEEENGTI